MDFKIHILCFFFLLCMRSRSNICSKPHTNEEVQFKSNLELEDFVFNDYDPCVANRVRHTYQQTIRFHVDDILGGSKSKKANNEFHAWCDQKYGSIKKVKCHRGGIHQFLGMTLDFQTKKGAVHVL